MRTMGSMPPGKQRRIAQETLQVGWGGWVGAEGVCGRGGRDSSGAVHINNKCSARRVRRQAMPSDQPATHALIPAPAATPPLPPPGVCPPGALAGPLLHQGGAGGAELQVRVCPRPPVPPRLVACALKVTSSPRHESRLHALCARALSAVRSAGMVSCAPRRPAHTTPAAAGSAHTPASLLPLHSLQVRAASAVRRHAANSGADMGGAAAGGGRSTEGAGGERRRAGSGRGRQLAV